jgi:hypothetical protein
MGAFISQVTRPYFGQLAKATVLINGKTCGHVWVLIYLHQAPGSNRRQGLKELAPLIGTGFFALLDRGGGGGKGGGVVWQHYSRKCVLRNDF